MTFQLSSLLCLELLVLLPCNFCFPLGRSTDAFFSDHFNFRPLIAFPFILLSIISCNRDSFLSTVNGLTNYPRFTCKMAIIRDSCVP